MLLTKSDYIEELECWLHWYLNILCFDHVVIFDNESPINIQSVISKFPKDKIDYRFIPGWPNQYKLYTEYLKESKAQWVIPLDDDEYLYIGKNYNHNIRDLINSLSIQHNKNKYYFLWVNLFSPEYLKSKSGLYVETHTAYSYKLCRKMRGSWPEDNSWGKCLINNSRDYIYSTSYMGGHIPQCTNDDNTTILACNGTEINSCSINNISEINEDCFIAHYQYKSEFDWKLKCSRQSVYSQSISISSKKHIYNNLYSHKEPLSSCFLIKNLWNNYRSNLGGFEHE